VAVEDQIVSEENPSADDDASAPDTELWDD
jgi:hypothetical protein